MVSSMKLWSAFALVVSIAAFSLEKRDRSIVVGYRTVRPGQAKEYYDAGSTLVYSAGHSSDQLGPGAYVSPILADWPLEGDFWDCAILAQEIAWNLINKAWVPATADDGCTPLWWPKGEPNRNAYLKEIGGQGFTTSNTVLLSKIDGFEKDKKLQLLIPPALMGKSGGLGLQVQCAAKTNKEGIDALGAYGNVDWYSWINIKGAPQRYDSEA